MASRDMNTDVEGEILPRVRSVTQEGISLFHESFGGSNPIHTDEAAAKQSDFGAPIQHGIRTMYPIFSMLVDRYGKLFLEGGTLKGKFIAPVVAGDVITSHVRKIGRSEENGADYLQMEIWSENSRGEKVFIGSAQVKEKL